MKRRRLVGVVTVFLLSAVAISVVLAITSAAPRPSSARIVDQTALRFVTAALVDDLKAALTGQESAIGTFKTDDPLKWIAVDRKVTARDYDAAYSANEIAADDEFKEKKMLVSGTIDGIEKDFTGRGFLTLRGSGYSLGVHAELEDEITREAASFRRGQKIDLVCRGAGRMATLAVLDQCRPLNNYMSHITPSVQSKADDFLNGRISMPRETATAIVMLYLTSKSLPADSSCRAGATEKCQDEVMARFKDPAQLQKIKDQTNQMLSSLMIEPK